jgi:membrane fusion protein (multidrug efflux system)
LAGTVREIAFESGGLAQRGRVLVRLDTSSERAQLQSAMAESELAKRNLERAQDLRAKDLISQSDLDAAEAAVLQRAGIVDDIQATIEKKTIRAPFGGRLGIRAVNLGQFVNAGDPIVSLQSWDPVYVDFTLPENRIGVLKRGLPVRVSTDAGPGQTFEGTITALEPAIEAATRNMKVQATLPNPDGTLRPGMFARVELLLEQSIDTLVVPASAVLHAPYGDSVFVITEGKDPKSGVAVLQAQMTTVRLGETRGDLVAITSGLQEGQQIATSGVFKLRNGTAVAIDNSMAPVATTQPQPADS